MNKVHNIIVIILVYSSLLVFSLGCQNVSENTQNENAEIDSGYFKLEDDTINIKTLHNIKNLALKNGFKNIKLGSPYSDFKFNKTEYEFEEYLNGKIRMISKQFEKEKIEFNGVLLSNLELVFYLDKLIIICIEGQQQETNKRHLFRILTDSYGEPLFELEPIKINRGLSRLHPLKAHINYLTGFRAKPKQSVIKSQENKSIIKNSRMPFKNLSDLPFLPSESYRISQDPNTNQYYREYDPVVLYECWRSENVQLVYKFNNKTKGYYRNYNSEDFPHSPDYFKDFSYEVMIISNYKYAEMANSFINDAISFEEKRIKDSIDRKKEVQINGEFKEL